MWILLACLVLIVMGAVVVNVSGGNMESLTGIVVIACVFLAITLLAAIPINREDTLREVAKFRAVEWTLGEARLHGEVMENAALMIKVAESNEWLAGAKFYNNETQWGVWVPDTVDNIQFIK